MDGGFKGSIVLLVNHIKIIQHFTELPDPAISPPDPPDDQATPDVKLERETDTPINPNHSNSFCGISAANSTTSFSEDSRDSSISLSGGYTPRARYGLCMVGEIL